MCSARAKPAAGGLPGEYQQQQQQQQLLKQRRQQQHRKWDPPRLTRDWLPLPGSRRGRARANRPDATGGREILTYFCSSHLCTRPGAATGGSIGGKRAGDMVEATVLYFGDNVILGWIIFTITIIISRGNSSSWRSGISKSRNRSRSSGRSSRGRERRRTRKRSRRNSSSLLFIFLLPSKGEKKG